MSATVVKEQLDRPHLAPPPPTFRKDTVVLRRRRRHGYTPGAPKVARSTQLRNRGLAAVLAVAAVLLLPACGGAAQQQPVALAAPLKVAFWGDSLTQGFPQPPFAADQSDSLPGAYASQNPGSEVYNGGFAGQSAAEVAVRQGGLTLKLNVDGNTIPARGAVTVTPANVIGWRLDRNWGDEGTLGGVEGTLTKQLDVFQFKRADSGQEVPVDAPLPWVSELGTAYRDDVQVLFTGRNDIGYTSPAGDPAARIVAATAAMVDSLPEGKRALVCSVTTTTEETRGTDGYNAVAAVNARLQAEYPYSYFDVREWLIHDALAATGVTPTPEDEAAITADTLPPSIMVPGDTTHYNPATAAALAREIADQLSQRGWGD